MTTDVLSQVLTLIRLKGECVYAAQLRAPWGFEYQPGASHFYFVTEGACWAVPGRSQAVRAQAGDLLLLPHGRGHVLTDQIGGPVESFDRHRTVGADAHNQLVRGETGACTHLIAGQFRFDGQAKLAILASLPEVIHIKQGGIGAPEWLRAISHFLLEEATHAEPGSDLMVSRLIDLLVIRVLRTWSSERSSNAGWLTGVGDSRIGRALSAIHAEPSRTWSIADLAAESGMSRSLFAQRFKDTVGQSPLRYLNQWRLTNAADTLQSGGVKVTEVAKKAGFSSDAAFSRAFKAYFGYSPADAKPNIRVERTQA